MTENNQGHDKCTQEDTEQDQNDQGQFKLDQEEIHSD